MQEFDKPCEKFFHLIGCRWFWSAKVYEKQSLSTLGAETIQPMLLGSPSGMRMSSTLTSS